MSGHHLTPKNTSGTRLDIEFLRFISALGIIWFHSGAIGHNIGYAGLVVFLVLSVFFSKPDPPQHILKNIYTRLLRLIKPWLIWSFIFIALDLLRGRSFFEKNLNWIIIGGAVHLWYLPFIFLSLSILDFIKLLFSKKIIFWISVISAAGILALVPLWRPWSMGLPMPFAQYFHAAFAIFLGIIFLYAQNYQNNILFAVTGVMFILIAPMVEYPGVGTPYLIGALLSLIVFAPQKISHCKNLIETLGRHSFGIYLLHPLFFFVSKKFFGAEELFVPVITATISIFVVHFIYLTSEKTYKFLF